MAELVQYRGTGRRKSAVARVILTPGSGQFLVNGKPFVEYIPSAATRIDVMQPIDISKNEGKYDISANVDGGGIGGQAGAIRLGITRALLEMDPSLRALLKPYGLITRDPRKKERKKPGLKKARKSPQFSKR